MDGHSYSGSDTYKTIDKLLKSDSENLFIITPYIDSFYASLLIKESARKKIYLLTSGSPVNNSAIKKLSSFSDNPFLKPALYFAVLAVILLYARFYYFSALVAAICAIMIALAFMRGALKNRNLHLKVSRGRFFHEKLYIADSAAITGSANLTFRGTHKNVEHVEYTEDESKISGLRSHFKSVWKSC